MIQTSQANRDIMADPLTRSLDEVLFGRRRQGEVWRRREGGRAPAVRRPAPPAKNYTSMHISVMPYNSSRAPTGCKARAAVMDVGIRRRLCASLAAPLAASDSAAAPPQETQ